MATTWAEFERAEPELASFGHERLHERICFHATLRRDGWPRVHPVEPWIATGLLLVRFRAHSPKVDEVRHDGRAALHSPMDDPDGVGGEFLVRGWLEAVGETHPAVQRYVHDAEYALAFYSMSVEEAVATTYEGPDTAPVYRRWRAPKGR